MSIEVTLLISVISVSCAVYFGLKNNKRADDKEIEQRATERAETNYKLDEIGRNVNDIKYDISETRKEVRELAERMASVEASTKQAHHRIDRLDKTNGEEDS